MNKIYLEKVFSTDRMNKYSLAYPGDEAKCIVHYQCNMQLSEAFYPILSILEVALRNSTNRELIAKFGAADWYNHFSTTAGLGKLIREIAAAQNQITKRRELITPSKIVAELTLGFWVRLFNAEFERILWKDLRRAFPYLSKVDRQRKNVSAPLNNFRNLRNRIFHNEPIAWNLGHLQKLHDEIIVVMGWVNKDLPSWASSMDRFNSVLAEVRTRLI